MADAIAAASLTVDALPPVGADLDDAPPEAQAASIKTAAEDAKNRITRMMNSDIVSFWNAVQQVNVVIYDGSVAFCKGFL